MGQGVGELNVGVTARTGKASKNIRGFTKDIKGVKGGAMGMSKGLGVAAIAVAGLAAGVAVLRRTFQSMSELDALGKTADKLGMTTQKLAGLRLAAEETGVATKAFDKGLQDMVRGISEAASGTGEAKGALEELGLAAQKMELLAPDEQFRKIAAAMANVTNHADKVRIAYRLFGARGVALVNTLKLGVNGLDETQAAAERLGIALDRSAIKKVEEANDAVGRIGHSFAGLGNSLAVTFAPAIEWAAGAATEFVGIFQTMPRDLGFVDEAAIAAADAIDEKRLADERAAAAAEVHRQSIEKQTAAYMKLVKAESDRQAVAEQGQAGYDMAANEEEHGRTRAVNINAAREQADQAEAIADQEERLEALKKRNADHGKTRHEIERDDWIANAETRTLQEEGRRQYDELEAKEKARKASEEADQAAQAAREKSARQAETAAKKKADEAKAEAKHVFEENKKAAGNVGTAGGVDARSAEGFTALQSSVNAGLQKKLLDVNVQQLAVAEETNGLFDELTTAGSMGGEVVQI